MRYIRTQDPSAGGRILDDVAYGGKPTRPHRARRPGLAPKNEREPERLQILLDVGHHVKAGWHRLLAKCARKCSCDPTAVAQPLPDEENLTHSHNHAARNGLVISLHL